MNIFFDIEELYQNIIPKKRKNNEIHIDTALKMKRDLQKSEEELYDNLNKQYVFYGREHCITNNVIVQKSEGDFLRNKMYGEWFYKSEYYTKLTMKSENCCYCFIGPVDELDHFFNKNDNPELSISNANLVPSCTKCNKRKEQGAIYLQPYFEDVKNYEWLDCKFDWSGFEGKPKVEFLIVHPNLMSQAMYDKLDKQLPQKRIKKKMIKDSMDYISSQWNTWKLQAKTNDNDIFKLIIETGRNDKRDIYGVNSWQHLVYKKIYLEFDEFIKKLNE